MEAKKRWIDGLKGMATTMVVLVHCGGGNLSFPFSEFGKIGANGVQLFFVISGFLTFQSLDRFFGNKKICLDETARWILKKIVRLFPLYYLSLIIGILRGGNKFWLAGKSITIGNVISHFLFIHGLFPRFNESIIGVEWYLGALIVFYIVSPFIFKITNKNYGILTNVFVIISFCSYYLCDRLVDYYRQLPDAFIYVNYFERFSCWSQLPVFLIGAWIFYVYKWFANSFWVCGNRTVTNSLSEDTKRLLSNALFGVSVLMIIGQAFGRNTLVNTYPTTLFGIWFGLMFTSQMLFNNRIVTNRIFCFLGKYSYPIYLFHYHILGLYKKYITYTVGNSDADIILCFGIVLVITICISIICTRAVEKPLLKKLQF